MQMTDEQRYLDRAIARYSPSVATTAKHSLEKLRTIFPGASLLVYDRRQSLPIGIASASGGSAVFSIVLYPRWVRFFFLEGVELEDPAHRLEGAGSQVRSVRVDPETSIFDDPYILGLIEQAAKLSRRDLRSGKSLVIIKSRFDAGTVHPPASSKRRTKKPASSR